MTCGENLRGSGEILMRGRYCNAGYRRELQYALAHLGFTGDVRIVGDEKSADAFC